jgi:hypothetical protein
VAITDDILALRKEQELAQQEKQGPSWIKELIDRRYAPQQERIKRVPVGFDFKRDPFDPSSYYKQVGSFRDISRAASGVVEQEVANRKNAEAQKAWEEAMNSIGGVNPKFTGGPGQTDGNFVPSGKSRKYGLKGVTTNTAKAADYWGSKYGIRNIGGYREHGSVPGSDHPKGRALDFMTNNIKNGMKTGTALANDVIRNYKAWNVSYVIWNRYIWSPSKGWRRYNGPSPHTDHVHVSFNK